LFENSIGRTDLPGGNHQQLINSIKNQIFQLPDETLVYCGHGNETTIKTEKSSNPFLS
jgi:glyoxylase-like metal-dependent hydrolase (beta-lactamase superfamily II)